jgi:hypothetical protein
MQRFSTKVFPTFPHWMPHSQFLTTSSGVTTDHGHDDVLLPSVAQVYPQLPHTSYAQVAITH